MEHKDCRLLRPALPRVDAQSTRQPLRPANCTIQLADFTRQALQTLLSARAIENQIYTIGCNRTGVDKYGDYTTGMSSIFDNLGEDIKETRRNGHIYALLDLTNLKEGRERFPAYRSSDHFSIDLTPAR